VKIQGQTYAEVSKRNVKKVRAKDPELWRKEGSRVAQ